MLVLRSLLQETLASARTDDSYDNLGQQLFDELTVRKAGLLKVYDFGGRDPKELKELETGKIQLEDRQVAINNEFIQQTVFLSTRLNLSERFCAQLLHTVLANSPNCSPIDAIENAIVELHEIRRAQADSYRLLLECCCLLQEGYAGRLVGGLEEFVRRFFVGSSKESGINFGATSSDASLASRIFSEICNLAAEITNARTAVTNAVSKTNLGQGCQPALGHAILSARLESFKYERRSLALSLFFMGRAGYLSSGDLVKMLDWLERNSPSLSGSPSSITPSYSFNSALNGSGNNGSDDAISYHIFFTLLASFDFSHSPESSPGSSLRIALLKSPAATSSILKKIGPTSVGWKNVAMKNVLLLKWTLFCLEGRIRDPTLDGCFKNDELELQILNSIQGDALSFALQTVRLIAPPKSSAAQVLSTAISPITNSVAPGMSSANSSGGAVAENAVSTLTVESKQFLLHELELLVRLLLTHASSELRKIKHKQEDQFRPRADRIHHRASTNLSSSTADFSVHERGGTNGSTTATQLRNDIFTLFVLIGALYSALPPDSAIQFWGGIPITDTPAYYELVEAERSKLPSFLRWAVEVQAGAQLRLRSRGGEREGDDHDWMIVGVFDMLAGLSNGQSCAECAYNFMAAGTLDVVHGSAAASGRYGDAVSFTWGSMFAELDSWATIAVPRAAGSGHAAGGPVASSGHPHAHAALPAQIPLSPKDVLLALSFLGLLTSVATHSVQARVAVATHPAYRTIATLLALIPLGVPLELKGSLFEALASFCLPGAGAAGVDVCRNVWAQMERIEVINVGGNLSPYGRSHFGTSRGVELELEEIEASSKVYPATIPFLYLLSTLIHTPKRIPLKSRVNEPEQVNTIPDVLGQPYRHPGIGPYVNFVLDTVLAKLPSREFQDPADSWRLTDLALCFAERCLASYELESLPSLAEPYRLKGPEVLIPVLQHPGFDILVRILSDTPLRNTLLSYVIEGSEELARRRQGEPAFVSVLTRSLRIFDRVLAIQNLFIENLIPVLSEFDSTAIIGQTISQSFLSPLDQALSFQPKSAPAIASYICHLEYPELAFLAIKILSSLADSHSFQSIGSIIEKSPESDVVLEAFIRLLASDDSGDVATAEEWADLWVGAGAPDEIEEDNFTQAIRLAIIDLLLQGTKPSKSSSLAFFILFGSAQPSKQIQDPNSLDGRKYCIHTVLELLGTGIPRLNMKGKERRRDIQTAPLFEAEPVLAERLYKLVYRLCMHPKTSSGMLLYLRTSEDFFARQLATMSFHVPIDAQPSGIEVVYRDGSRVTTSCKTLKAFLQLRSWLLDLVALELHVLSNKTQNQRLRDLLDLIFGSTDPYHDLGADWETDIFRPFNDVGQSHIRAIEIFQSLEFEWFDSVTPAPVQLDLLKTLNLQACVRMDDAGCEVIDRDALFQLLSLMRKTLVSQGRITTQPQSQRIETEAKYILESCVAENNRREVQFALTRSFESWKRLINVIMTKCFNRIAHDQKESIIFDLLHVIPSAINSATTSPASTVQLSETLVMLIPKLREGRKQLAMASAGLAAEASSLPVERMHGFLRSILECIMDNRRTELVRGNLYATLINYLHMVLSSSHSEDASRSIPPENERARIANGRSLKVASLESGTIAILNPVMERLVMAIAKDAIDGAEVWKTISYTLLDSLVSLMLNDRKHTILSALERYGLLANFVHGIRDADQVFQAVLRPDPDDLNPLYVYESKMSFLIRLSQTRQGAERLVESRIFNILAQAEFLDARPEADESFVDRDSFLPSAVARYRQFFMPALQLVEGILATLGSNHAVANKQALEFIHNHRETFSILLKEDAVQLTLPALEELTVIVSMCSLVVPTVPKSDLLAVNSGYGGLHVAILTVAARFLGVRRWNKVVMPIKRTEFQQAETSAFGYGAYGSIFDGKAITAGLKFRKAILSYLSVSSASSEEELTVVLSPVVISRRDERSSGIAAPIPSLGDAVDALNDFCDDLLAALEQMVDISAELEKRENVRVDNIEEMVDPAENDLVQRLDVQQKRALIVRIFEDAAVESRKSAAGHLTAIEILLLLIWRHVEHYNESLSASSSTLSSTVPRIGLNLGGSQLQASNNAQSRSMSQSLKHSTMRFLVVQDSHAFVRDVALSVGRVLEKVEGLGVGENDVTREWQASGSYIEIMCRRLRETIEISRPPDGRMEIVNSMGR